VNHSRAFLAGNHLEIGVAGQANTKVFSGMLEGEAMAKKIKGYVAT